MNTLCYSTSEPPHDNNGCEVCLPRKGHAHTCTHTLRYYGQSLYLAGAAKDAQTRGASSG